MQQCGIIGGSGEPVSLEKGLRRMGVWFRVFGTNEGEPDPASLVAHLREIFLDESTIRFRRDEEGWFTADVLFPGCAQPWRLNRYLASEEGIRAELNSWAAWLEAAEDNRQRDQLMLHLINSRQVFTFEVEIGDLDPIARIDRWCHGLCQLLARQTEGVYQADGQGFFAADGTLLLQE